MGTSFQRFADRVEPFNDLDLVALICLMERALEANANEFVMIKPFVTQWQRGLESYGPGTIALKLDKPISSAALQAAAAKLEALLGRAGS